MAVAPPARKERWEAARPLMTRYREVETPLCVRKSYVWFLFLSSINEPHFGAAILLRGGRGGLLAFEKDIPGIPLSV